MRPKLLDELIDMNLRERMDFDDNGYHIFIRRMFYNLLIGGPAYIKVKISKEFVFVHLYA